MRQNLITFLQEFIPVLRALPVVHGRDGGMDDGDAAAAGAPCNKAGLTRAVSLIQFDGLKCRGRALY